MKVKDQEKDAVSLTLKKIIQKWKQFISSMIHIIKVS